METRKYFLKRMSQENRKKIKKGLEDALLWDWGAWYGTAYHPDPPEWYLRNPLMRFGFPDAVNDIVDALTVTYYLNPEDSSLYAFSTLYNQYMTHLVLHDKVSVVIIRNLGGYVWLQ